MSTSNRESTNIETKNHITTYKTKTDHKSIVNQPNAVLVHTTNKQQKVIAMKSHSANKNNTKIQNKILHTKNI